MSATAAEAASGVVYGSRDRVTAPRTKDCRLVAAPPRPREPAGLVIGLLDNGKPGAGAFMDRLGAAIGQEIAAGAMLRFTKLGGPDEPAGEDFLASISSRCLIVVVGVGSCWSCASRAIRDSMRLERAGVQTITVVSETLRSAAEAQCRFLGMPSLPIATTRRGLNRDSDPRVEAGEAAPVLAVLEGMIETPSPPSDGHRASGRRASRAWKLGAPS